MVRMAGSEDSRNESSGSPELTPDGRRVAVRVQGIVQGVGFRPTVYQLAERHRLGGWVRNQSDGVRIEVAGAAADVKAFLGDLRDKAPPLARIVSVEITELPFEPSPTFEILESHGRQNRSTLVSPDVATCRDCLRELFDPTDRRFGYPFINCTNCGPRYTIIRDIPYDREKTTMARFAMCPECLREYRDPRDRRFHAQPNACWVCGPNVWLEDPQGNRLSAGRGALADAVERLKEGQILAVKGLGGFHLAVEATGEERVRRLRRRKIREEKPFAVMFRDLDAVTRHCRVSPEEATLLEAPERPIVLLRKREKTSGEGTAPIAETVAPRNRFLGAFLPYTPLHHLLFFECPYEALVMTSGNRSDEPIVTDNDEARLHLREIADAFLFHDRDIHIRCDDSVVRLFGGAPRPLRRARGYVPVPIFLEAAGPSVLAVGGELKNTLCITRGAEAFVSQHIGDLENLETLRAFERNVDHLQRILEIRPELVAHDLHPDYLSTQWAERQDRFPVIAVQHHHAHIASVLAERKISGPVLGLALDGTGYGPDGTIWGGELLWVKAERFRRLGRFRHLRLPGGDRAVREPWRTAVALLHLLAGGDVGKVYPDILNTFPVRERPVVLAMLERRLNCPLTSSCGRLFDAVSAILGVRHRVTYEGQAAVELEQAAQADSGHYVGALYRRDDLWILDPLPMIQLLVEDLRRGVAPGILSTRFHNGLALLLAEALEKAREATGLDRVALSGGVFQNLTLSQLLEADLVRRGFEVLAHREVPPNDACISLGQAHVARARLSRGR